VSSQTALARIVAALDALHVPHMIAGSFASTFHGEPRTTHDIDIVIDPSRDSLDRFVRSLAPEVFYVCAAAADERDGGVATRSSRSSNGRRSASRSGSFAT
jgi:hypothetical protein